MSKQPKTKVPTDAALKGNPLIGGSKGTTGAGTTADDGAGHVAHAADDLGDAQGASTIEGDEMNDTNAHGGVDKVRSNDRK